MKINVERVCQYNFKRVVKIFQLYELYEMKCYPKIDEMVFLWFKFNPDNPAVYCPGDTKYLEWRILLLSNWESLHEGAVMIP